MKDYKEIAAEVFARRDEYLIKQKKRRKAIAATTSLCALLCIVIGVAVGYGRPEDNDGADGGVTVYGGIEPIMTTDGKSNGDRIESVARRAGVASSELVVYGTVNNFDELGSDIFCTLSVERTLKGEDADTVSFNISEEDREDFMALVQGGKGVFFLSEGEHGLVLTHGGPSIFYEAGEDDYRSYDETGLICYYLTMEEIESLTQAGL